MVHHLHLGLTGIDLTLAAHGRVADGDGGRLGEELRHVADNDDTDKDHGAVGEEAGRRLDERAVLLHLGVAHQHVLARNADVLEAEEAVVDAVHAQLGADLTDFDAGQRHVSLLVAQLHDEREDAATLTLRVQLGDDDAVVGGMGH